MREFVRQAVEVVRAPATAIVRALPLRPFGGAWRRFSMTGRAFVTLAPSLWLFLFFLAPFAIVLMISLAEPMLGRPPYAPLFAWADELSVEIRITFANYAFLWRDDLYLLAYLNSLRIALISTAICLVIGYPMAYAIARANPTWRMGLLMLVILPFWTSFLIRVYAWMGILRDNGFLNNLLMWLGLTDAPIQMMQTDFAVYVGITYTYLPFMVLPLYATLQKMDLGLLEAAADLGASPMRAFLSITLPLSIPGIIAGSFLVFIPAVGEFVIPTLLGGPDTLMIGRVLWDEFFLNNSWPVASAVAIAMLLLLVLPMIIFQYYQALSQERR